MILLVSLKVKQTQICFDLQKNQISDEASFETNFGSTLHGLPERALEETLNQLLGKAVSSNRQRSFVKYQVTIKNKIKTMKNYQQLI